MLNKIWHLPFWVFPLLCLDLPVFARDVSHYPYHSVAHAATITEFYKGSYKQYYPIYLQVGVDEQFSASQRQIIDQALRVFVERAFAEPVLSCAFRQAYKDLAISREKFTAQLYEALRPLPLEAELIIPAFAFIARYEQDLQTVGIGYVDLFNDTDKPLKPFKNRHYLYIALNSDYLASSSSFPYAWDKDYWAGVIAHEFLHNLGFIHPTGYSGSFIYEYGKCLASYGSDFMSLEEGMPDQQVFRCPDE